MIIDRLNNLGLIEKEKSFNGKGLFILNFNDNTKQELTKYEDWNPLSLSLDSETLVLNSQWISFRGTNKTELVVLNRALNEVEYSTKNFLVYDAALSNGGNKILLDVHNKKPFCLNTKTLEMIELPKKGLRIYKGTFNHSENRFYIPSETKKKCVYSFSFDDGMTDEVTLSVVGKVEKIKYLDKENKYIISSSEDVLYGFSEDLTTKYWEINFKELDDVPSRIWASNIFNSESQEFIFLSAPSTKENNWGVDYLINSRTGIINNYLDNFQGRGRIAQHFFDNKVILHSGKILDMISEELTENELIKTIPNISRTRQS